MVYRKGELSSTAVDRNWPHQVAIPVDVTASRFHEIQSFTGTLSMSPRGRSVVSEGIHYTVYCFESEGDAFLFRERYDGIPFNPKDRGKGSN